MQHITLAALRFANMRFHSAKDGLHITIDTERLPGSESAFSVDVDVKFDADFLSSRLGIQQAGSRSFAGKLAESVDLVEVSDDEVRRCTPFCASKHSLLSACYVFCSLSRNQKGCACQAGCDFCLYVPQPRQQAARQLFQLLPQPSQLQHRHQVQKDFRQR